MKLAPLALLALVTGSSIKKRSSIPAFDYQNDKVRGVNLGGWFVLEPYMNPSMFSIFSENDVPVDEYHYTQQLGKDEAFKILDNHWDTWISEQDFKQLSDWGFNTARIPIGYWAFLARDQDPYVQGQTKYLDRALGWARTHNIKVWIDLHGVPGSQNGFDNSGLRDSYYWQSEQYPENMAGTYEALEKIVEAYGGEDWIDVVSGIELVNEPLGSILDMNKLHDYYNQGYGKVRDAGVQGVIIHDAFKDYNYFNDWLQLPDYWNVVLDHHRYQVFSVPELQRTTDEHVEYACQLGRDMKGEDLWHVNGEWSAALTDCAKWLNGMNRGARYDATYENDQYLGSCENNDDISSWSQTRKDDTRRYVEAQLDAFEQGAGWIFWAYKTENAPEWDLCQLMNNGLFPYPLTDRKYPNQCGY